MNDSQALVESIELLVHHETFRLAEVFTISRGSRTEARVISVELNGNGCVGRGECVPYARYGESMESVEAQIRSLTADLAHGMNRTSLQARLPAGAARNALDCALWDLESKQKSQPVWQLAGLPEPAPVTTAYTLSLADPEIMRRKAREHAARPLLKIKLGGQGDMERLQAVRDGAPDAVIIVDANEGWSAEQYVELAPRLVALGVSMVEQPLPADQDDVLAEIERPLPVCADESCHDVATLANLAGKYDMINIKLDKTGGLTEAIALHEAARLQGYQVMVGCMIGSSLAMAPAMLVAQGAQIVDLDAPLLLAEDRSHPLSFDGSEVSPPDSSLWG